MKIRLQLWWHRHILRHGQVTRVVFGPRRTVTCSCDPTTHWYVS